MRHVLLISGLCLSASLAFGQTFGSITGEVRDPSGAVMPNASVTATEMLKFVILVVSSLQAMKSRMSG